MRLPDERVNHAARRRRVMCVLHFAFCIALSGCAARRLPLPSDPGSPLVDYAAIHARVASACRGVRTLEAVIALRGQAGAQRLSGRVRAGFERPDSMRLEGVAPFGPPAFLLAARRGTAVLLLPREDRVVTGEPAETILGALTGISLAPDDLQAILTGCVVPAPQATGGRLHAGGWATIDLEGGSTLYLRRAGDWQLRAATRDGWQVDYSAWQGTFPQTVRLRSGAGRVNVDMTATLSQIEANVGLDEAAFTIAVPPSAQPLTIDELRDAGPLGVQE
jgi:outer membrane biogenesis lipoprotein LolB